MRALLCLAALLGLPLAASASDGLSDALAARSHLGAQVWARVVRIENTSVRGALRRSPYPDTVYALVFELSGALWFYSDANGTQSLSLRLGAIDADKADPGPLFKAIDPGFARWSWVDSLAGWRHTPAGELPNGCFIESVAALFRRVAAGGEAQAPRLLSYYIDTPFGRQGHTVLLFAAKGGLAAVDPELSERPVAIPAKLGSNPRALSAYLRGGPVASARTLPIECARRPDPAGRWASVAVPQAPAG
jgi:hypothetical protein